MKIKASFCWVLCCSCFLVPSQGAEIKDPGVSDIAATSDGIYSYDVIVGRNTFRLVAKLPEPVTEPPKPELPAVKISGFSDTAGMTTVFFATAPKDPKERAAFFALSDKVRAQGILQLVKIHPDHEAVDVLINDTPVTLSIKDNSFVPSLTRPAKVTAGPPPLPGAPTSAPAGHR